ncbi:hypothetical protein X777_15983 [Ooceraea biroi]|uniref:Uncharacterized protein n=1 Tax=Ooceraea biroi TaxID=2015173 RepID=A0A026WTJ8_OOCBI|nr:hypothetical protein X777_15983 [Ooceraea biroi]
MSLMHQQEHLYLCHRVVAHVTLGIKSGGTKIYLRHRKNAKLNICKKKREMWKVLRPFLVYGPETKMPDQLATSI